MGDGVTSVGPERRVGVVVAHPDDETLWAGGLILSRPRWAFRIASTCRRGDPDRAPKFARVCTALGSRDFLMADLDDSPEQSPISPEIVEETILELLAVDDWDIIITHSPEGEYTSHRRHEEVSIAVARLWAAGKLSAREVWMFAYEDAGRTKLPEAYANADLRLELRDDLYLRKYALITEEYGFDLDSWEARTTPRIEGFWMFGRPSAVFERFGSQSATSA